MEDINDINDINNLKDALIEIRVAKKKSTTKKITKKTSKESKTEQKEKNAFHKKYNNIFVHLNRLKRWRYQKKSKYYKTPTDLPQDIIMLIKNKYSTIKDIENLYSTLIKSRCFSVIKNRFEEIIELENNNNNQNFNKNLNKDDNQDDNQNDENIDDINNRVDEIDNIIRETDKKIIDIILNILQEIKNKFEIISEKIMYDTLSSTHYYNDVSSDIVKFFKDNGYKIKTKKIFINLLNFFNQNFLDIIDFDKINIDDEILEKILLSQCMHNTNYENIEKIYNILNNNNVNFFDILIKIILNYEFYRSQATQQKVFNIFNFVIKINPSKCLEILQHIPFIVFADNYFDDDFNLYDDNFDIKNIINKIKNNINTTFNIYIDKLDKLDNISKFSNIYDVKIYSVIDDKIVKELFNLIHPYFIDNTQNKKNKRRRMQKKIIVIKNDNIYYDFIDEHTYNFFGKQITGSEIKEIYNIIRKIFYNYICNKFTKEKDIIKITDCSIFKYNNFLLNNEEKINLFKNIFNGKILANDITSFIINNNEIADFLITKSKLNENLIKTAFKMSNYNFINRMIELKYNMKTSYLKYINQDEYLIDILKIINKYNTLEFDDEIDWALHLKYLNPNINISEYIYDENNEELRKQLNEKINKYLELSIIDKFNLMNFDEFIGYVNSNKIKININDLIKINDYRKRVILLDHIKM